MNTKYVCSLELAKRLKELGVEQESDFWWALNPRTLRYALKDSDEHPVLKDIHHVNGVAMEGFYSAFHVGELGEILPDDMTTFHYHGQHFCEQMHKSIKGKSDTEANCRAKMLIYLIENKLIQVQSKRRGR